MEHRHLKNLEDVARVDYIGFYIFMVIANAALVTSFGIMAFSDSPGCFTGFEDHNNITNWFMIAFKGNFVLNLLNFCFFTFLDPKIRQVHRRHELNFDRCTPKDAIFLSTLVIGIVLNVARYVAFALTVFLLQSRSGRYCTSETDILSTEGTWLLVLASL